MKLAWTEKGHVGKARQTSRTDTGFELRSFASKPRDARTAVTTAAGAPVCDSSILVS